MPPLGWFALPFARLVIGAILMGFGVRAGGTVSSLALPSTAMLLTLVVPTCCARRAAARGRPTGAGWVLRREAARSTC